MLRPIAIIVTIFASISTLTAEDNPDFAVVEKRALAFLVREVPRWSVENKCYSCHNNGDAARALYLARRFGRTIPAEALADTTNWVSRPTAWKDNGGDPAFSDKNLATLQFAASLVAARDAGEKFKPESFLTTADLVAKAQLPDGSWKPDGPDAIGSPATWGQALCTVKARHTLRSIDARRYRGKLALADKWLLDFKVESVLDAGALLIGLGDAADAASTKQRERCLELIHKGEGQGGGWGPYVSSPSEPFDTAVVLIGLAGSPLDKNDQSLISRGRAYLATTQLEDGTWPETTRPAGASSYAQRLSTTGWATQALLITPRP